MTAIPRDTAGYSLQAVTDPVIVLASLLTSEAPNYAKFPLYSEMIGGAVVNATTAMTLAMAMRHTAPAGTPASFGDCLVRRIIGTGVNPGKLGPQSGRWASTRQDPIAAHVALAGRILADPDRYAKAAKGAIQWTDQKTQVYMHAKRPETNPAPEPLMERRYRQGSRWVGPIDGVDPYVLSLLGPVGVPLEDALAMIADGRRRHGQPA